MREILSRPLFIFHFFILYICGLFHGDSSCGRGLGLQIPEALPSLLGMLDVIYISFANRGRYATVRFVFFAYPIHPSQKSQSTKQSLATAEIPLFKLRRTRIFVSGSRNTNPQAKRETTRKLDRMDLNFARSNTLSKDKSTRAHQTSRGLNLKRVAT